jgi:hypothetical protein
VSASQFHRRSTQSALTYSIAATEFKAGDRVRIKSYHPLFPNWNCAIAALPSPNAAIVELASGAREYLRTSDLQLLCDCCFLPIWQDNGMAIEQCHCHKTQPTTLYQHPEIVDNKITLPIEIYSESESGENNSNAQVIPLMTEAEAHGCIEAIKEHAISLRQLLVELEERKGWEALGYSSMTACMVAEFKNSKPVLVRELKVGRMEKRYLRVPIGTYLESQLRPLSQLEPTRYQEAIEKAHQIAGDKRITVAHVNQAVRELRSKKLFLNQPLTPPMLPYHVGDIVLVKCDRAITEPYSKYNGCWAVVSEVLAYGCSVQLMGREWNIHWNDLKAIDITDATLKQIANRVFTLLVRDDLDEMERDILERYHQRQWFTSWQLQLLQTLEELRVD